jgi:chromosome segregation ATPase
MFGPWKSRRGESEPAAVANGSEMLLLRSMLDYLQDRASTSETPPTATASLSGARPDRSEADTTQREETLETAQRFIADQRKIAEALLREVCTLEERLEIQLEAAQATRTYAEADQRAQTADGAARQAEELAVAATRNHQASQTQRREAEELVATSRGDAQTAEAAAKELEELLTHARRMVAEVSATLEQHEARAAECAAKERAAAGDATAAAQRVAAARNAAAEAEREARAAKERADNLKEAARASAPSFAGIADVQRLAQRISEAASALASESGAGWN